MKGAKKAVIVTTTATTTNLYNKYGGNEPFICIYLPF